MPSPHILAIGTGVPPERYRQDEIFEQVAALGLTSDPRSRAVFDHAGVDCRHAVVSGDYFAQPRGTAERNQCYLDAALPLGEQVIHRCLDAAGCAPDEVNDLIVVSCTGIDTPGLDLRLAGRLGLRADLRRATILGMGCYAAFPGLVRAREAALASGGRALVLALELCSLHLQMEDSLENVISAALFADGAAAALLGADACTPGVPGPQMIDAETYCDYSTFDHMAFHLTDTGFQMRLSAYVPDLLAAEISGFVDRLLARHSLTRADVPFWAVHPGSGKILDHVQDQLGLGDDQMAPSRGVLRDYGNMSSATILFVLDALQREADPQPGDYGVMMAFGPGLTMESALLRW